MGGGGLIVSGSADTNGKFSAYGNTIVLESRQNFGNGYVALVDAATGDTLYAGNGASGMYVQGTGAFALPVTGNGAPAQVYRNYRMTVTGTSISVERGDGDWNNITQRVTTAMGTSIAGKTFYVRISGGSSWITVKTDAVYARPNDYVPFTSAAGGCTRTTPSASIVELHWTPLIGTARYVVLKNNVEVVLDNRGPDHLDGPGTDQCQRRAIDLLLHAGKECAGRRARTASDGDDDRRLSVRALPRSPPVS